MEELIRESTGHMPSTSIASRGSARDTVSQGLRRARAHFELALFRDLARYPWRLGAEVQQWERISAGNPPKPNNHAENE